MNSGLVWDNRDLFLLGFIYTLNLTLVTIATSTLVGFALSLLRRANIPFLRLILRVYLEIFRGSPLLIQILFIYFGAAYLHLSGVSVFIAVVIAITLYQSTYISEIFRAGFESVPYGQSEAGRCLGLSRLSIMKEVVFPQAMKVAVPPLFGQYIALVKNTSLASVIGYADLVRQGQGIIDRIGQPFEIFFVIGALYFVISYPLSRVARRLERRNVTV